MCIWDLFESSLQKIRAGVSQKEAPCHKQSEETPRENKSSSDETILLEKKRNGSLPGKNIEPKPANDENENDKNVKKDENKKKKKKKKKKNRLSSTKPPQPPIDGEPYKIMIEGKLMTFDSKEDYEWVKYIKLIKQLMTYNLIDRCDYDAAVKEYEDVRKKKLRRLRSQSF